METQNTQTHKPDVTDRIKSIDDAILELIESDEEVVIYRKLLTLFDSDSHIVNYQTAVVLTKAVNEGWEPDWDNDDEPKYQLYFDMGGSSGFRCDVFVAWNSYSRVGSRLCFREPRLGKHLATQFPQVFKNFMTIKK